MADLVDPDKLMSLADVARKHGYNPQYFTRLAQEGKIRAWHIGNTWITTEAYVVDYIRNAGLPVRQKKKSKD